jgi:hypothetical protein
MEIFLDRGDCAGLLEYLHEITPEFKGRCGGAFRASSCVLEAPAVVAASTP